MGSPFAPNAVPAPVLQRRCPARPHKVWGHGTVSRSDGLCKIQGTVWRKPGAVRTLQPASFKHKDNTLQLWSQQPKTNFERLNNYIRFYLWKRKIPPTQRSDDFVGWNGGKIDRVCCGAVCSFWAIIHWKWWLLRWELPLLSAGFGIKGTMEAWVRQDSFAKFIVVKRW